MYHPGIITTVHNNLADSREQQYLAYTSHSLIILMHLVHSFSLLLPGASIPLLKPMMQIAHSPNFHKIFKFSHSYFRKNLYIFPYFAKFTVFFGLIYVSASDLF